jgi:hypothetical protein
MQKGHIRLGQVFNQPIALGTQVIHRIGCVRQIHPAAKAADQNSDFLTGQLY